MFCARICTAVDEAAISTSKTLPSAGGNGLTYKAAGVDIDAGNALVEAIKPLARATARPGADSELGGFGGFFDLKAAGFNDPVLVAANDGVGTKLMIAQAAGRHDTIGIDLVAMCVNDLVVQGAEPLFFLDYFASGKLSVDDATAVVAGIAAGCKDAGCALIGGETAEMPGLYGDNEYDLAGFAVGAVERDQALTGAKVAAGDVIIGIASSGFHSNGYSLVRRVVEMQGADYGKPAPFEPGRSLGEALLTPTRIYVRSCLGLVRAGMVHAFAHITGGGFIDNIPRVLPKGLAAVIDTATVTLPPMMSWLAKAGGVSAPEMARTFNCGIGMIAVVPESKADDAMRSLSEAGEHAHAIGRIADRGEGPAVVMTGLDQAWGL